MSSKIGTRTSTTPAPHLQTRARPFRGLVATGCVAVLAAVVVTTLAAVLAHAFGVDFELSNEERIPVSGIAFVTCVLAGLGVVIAAVLLRWSARPAERFVWTAVSLTVISLVPPVLAAANLATTAALIVLHLVAATVMVPALASSLRRSGQVGT